MVRYCVSKRFPGYRVGDDGSVWTKVVPGPVRRMYDDWRLMCPIKAGKGYLAVRMRDSDGKLVSMYVHHLVLFAFVGPRPDGMEARHFPDRDPTNNRVSNLSWATKKVNCADRITHKTHPRGEAHAHAKLTEKDVREIKSLLDAGMSQSRVGRRFGVDQRHVSLIKRGKRWGWLV